MKLIIMQVKSLKKIYSFVILILSYLKHEVQFINYKLIKKDTVFHTIDSTYTKMKQIKQLHLLVIKNHN